MKLKRIISALVVFTLVMTCAVCTVNAAGVYQATTHYTSDGKVSVTAEVTGANDGDFVSYIIYGDDDASNNDVDGVKEAVTEGNIKYIDQATVSGTVADFGTIEFDVEDIENRNIKFATNGEDLIAAETTVEQVTNPKAIDTTKMVGLGLSSFGNNLSDVTVEDAKGRIVVTELLSNGELRTQVLGYQKTIYLYPDSKSLTMSMNLNNGRNPLSGKVDLGFDLQADMVNGTVKLPIVDGNIVIGSTTKAFKAGSKITIKTPTGGKDAEVRTVRYMTINSDPYTHKTADGYDAVTFFITENNLPADNTGSGIDICVYDKAVLDKYSATGTTVGATPVKIYDNLKNLTGLATYGIQLEDRNGDGLLNSELYSFAAVPYYLDANGEKVQLKAFGDIPYYYTEIGVNVESAGSAEQ